MSRCMPTGLEQRQAGQEFGISINQPVTQGRMIPVSTRRGKARMSAARQCIVFALDDEFRLRKGIVISRVVRVEMGTDEDIDIVIHQSFLVSVSFSLILDYTRERTHTGTA